MRRHTVRTFKRTIDESLDFRHPERFTLGHYLGLGMGLGGGIYGMMEGYPSVGWCLTGANAGLMIGTLGGWGIDSARDWWLKKHRRNMRGWRRR